MGRTKRVKKSTPQRKRKKLKPVRTPNTRKPSAKRPPSTKRPPTPEERIVHEALRASPDMTKLLLENDGKLFVPPDYLEEEGVAVAASAQPKKLADVEKFLKMKQKYGEALAGEHAMSLDKIRRSSRPQTPVVPFGDYMKEQEAATQREKADESLLDDFAGTTFDPKNYKNDFTFSFEGGKRKSRRRKKSRRRRKKSRRRKTKRKSRRRRK